MIRRDRALIGILVLSAVLHVVGMIRTPLPSQDGLKFIRIAREFGEQPWADVVRRADQHPLYPALIAVAQPFIAPMIGEGPGSWRVAAQGVSALAMVAAVLPFFGFARTVVGRRPALLASLLFALLPISGRIGHDTLSDATALLCVAGALALGTRAATTGGVLAAVGSGAIAGIGFLARPEVALVPGVIALGVVGGGLSRRGAKPQRREGRGEREHRIFSRLPFRASAPQPEIPPDLPRRLLLAAAISAPLVACVGSYAAIKGTISEKLSMRYATGLGDGTGVARSVPHWVPRGLDDPRWDFSPKEESDAPGRLGPAPASIRVARGIGEATAWVLVPLACWGAWHHRGPRRSREARQLAACLAIAYGIVLIRHAMRAGYLSDRHCATLALLATPWAAAGAIGLARFLSDRLAMGAGRRRRLAITTLSAIAIGGVAVQLKPGHPSRWGHQAAGLWLADRAGAGEAVLDTRGWAAFVSGLRSYDPWHIRQALTDARLAYVVVGDDELTADSARAETLGALLDYAAEPVAAFPGREGDDEIGVRVYRFRRPQSWEGIVQ
ncbi:glycosyltransferase family 39 protein [Tautonia plasticadhaerens]|uniref:Glycosyltransferase RgtA/B/C/D-like domain-containing protein n=1 Tax=Tautonia plasticadhaerens TaxID=2527974 RepID=A0A518H574_9BACT|nr:glycosyltransferase family 39 protein [Tautonia plasticadhaerens]QDV35973.1 hypothetical protein ElP_38830 [Tautonia plasticadhaerens]